MNKELNSFTLMPLKNKDFTGFSSMEKSTRVDEISLRTLNAYIARFLLLFERESVERVFVELFL